MYMQLRTNGCVFVPTFLTHDQTTVESETTDCQGAKVRACRFSIAIRELLIVILIIVGIPATVVRQVPKALGGEAMTVSRHVLADAFSTVFSFPAYP